MFWGREFSRPTSTAHTEKQKQDRETQFIIHYEIQSLCFQPSGKKKKKKQQKKKKEENKKKQAEVVLI